MPLGPVMTRCCSVVDQQLDHSVSQSVSGGGWESPELPTDRTGWAGDDGGAERLIMRKNKFLMNNKESGDKTGERREDKRLSLAPPGYNINICYQVRLPLCISPAAVSPTVLPAGICSAWRRTCWSTRWWRPSAGRTLRSRILC